MGGFQSCRQPVGTQTLWQAFMKRAELQGQRCFNTGIAETTDVIKNVRLHCLLNPARNNYGRSPQDVRADGPLHPAMSQAMGLSPTTVMAVQWLGGLCHSGNISQLH